MIMMMNSVKPNKSKMNFNDINSHNVCELIQNKNIKDSTKVSSAVPSSSAGWPHCCKLSASKAKFSLQFTIPKIRERSPRSCDVSSI